jgi:hypothetical protein
MVRLFDKRAEWFVGAGWLLLAIAIAIALLESFAASLHLTYFPHGKSAPFAAAAIHIANAAMVASVAAAVSPSIALAFKFRITASTLAVGCWGVIFASYLLLRLLGISGVERLTGVGPQQIEHSIGSQRFDVPEPYQPLSVPDRYRPPSAGVLNLPDLPGFGFWVCGSNLPGRYDERCRGLTQVTVTPIETGFDRQYDVSFWRDRSSEMTTGEIRSGHQEYIYVTAPDDQGQTATTRYFVRQTPEGRLLRLAACSSFGHCRHHVRAADYALSYDAAESTLADWETKDRELTTLINSWRR